MERAKNYLDNFDSQFASEIQAAQSNLQSLQIPSAINHIQNLISLKETEISYRNDLVNHANHLQQMDQWFEKSFKNEIAILHHIGFNTLP